MPKLIAKRKFRYAGKQLNVGDSFEASDKDAKILTFTGSADEEKPKRQYKRRDMSAEA